MEVRDFFKGDRVSEKENVCMEGCYKYVVFVLFGRFEVRVLICDFEMGKEVLRWGFIL